MTQPEQEVNRSITPYRKKRLLWHINKLEKMAGRRCRKTRRGVLDDCPVVNYAPHQMRDGWLINVNQDGCLYLNHKRIGYLAPIPPYYTTIKLYTRGDSSFG